MSLKTTAYKCIYCEEIFKQKTIADRHEITCHSNPKSRNCLYCQNIDLNITNSGKYIPENTTCKIDGEIVSRLKAVKCKNFHRRLN